MSTGYNWRNVGGPGYSALPVPFDDVRIAVFDLTTSGPTIFAHGPPAKLLQLGIAPPESEEEAEGNLEDDDSDRIIACWERFPDGTMKAWRAFHDVKLALQSEVLQQTASYGRPSAAPARQPPLRDRLRVKAEPDGMTYLGTAAELLEAGVADAAMLRRRAGRDEFGDRYRTRPVGKLTELWREVVAGTPHKRGNSPHWSAATAIVAEAIGRAQGGPK